MECRRCRRGLRDGDSANLVARYPGDVPELGNLFINIIVCDDCLGARERGYLGGDLAERDLPGPVILTPGELEVLMQVAAGHVYRRPSRVKVMAGKKPVSGDRVVTSLAYRLLRFGLVAWVPGSTVPRWDQNDTTPTAWAELTEGGRLHLQAHFAALLGEGSCDV